MNRQALAALSLALACFILLFVWSSGGEAGAAPGAPLPAGDPACQIGGRMAEHEQYWEGIVIRPLEQHDEADHTQWVKTWRMWARPGWEINVYITRFRCVNIMRDPVSGYDQCEPDRATITDTHYLTLTIPVSGTLDFSTTDAVDCCEISESEIQTVNGYPWRSSFFLRWAEAPVCPIPTATATATPTITETPSATGTPTETSTPTEIATPTASATATETGTATATATPTGSATEQATATATVSETPSASETPTATPTASATATATASATGTPPPIGELAVCGGVYNGSTLGGVSLFNNYSCYAGDESGPDRLYTVQHPGGGDLGITLSSAGADLDVFILSAPAANACLAYGDTSATVPMAPAGVYYLVVDGFQGAASDYTFNVICPLPTPTLTAKPRLVFPIIYKEYNPVF